MFEFIKAVSDTVLDMTNAVYHDNDLNIIGPTFREKLLSKIQHDVSLFIRVSSVERPEFCSHLVPSLLR